MLCLGEYDLKEGDRSHKIRQKKKSLKRDIIRSEVSKQGDCFGYLGINSLVSFIPFVLNVILSLCKFYAMAFRLSWFLSISKRLCITRNTNQLRVEN